MVLKQLNLQWDGLVWSLQLQAGKCAALSHRRIISAHLRGKEGLKQKLEIFQQPIVSNHPMVAFFVVSHERGHPKRSRAVCSGITPAWALWGVRFRETSDQHSKKPWDESYHPEQRCQEHKWVHNKPQEMQQSQMQSSVPRSGQSSVSTQATN